MQTTCQKSRKFNDGTTTTTTSTSTISNSNVWIYIRGLFTSAYHPYRHPPALESNAFHPHIHPSFLKPLAVHPGRSCVNNHTRRRLGSQQQPRKCQRDVPVLLRTQPRRTTNHGRQILSGLTRWKKPSNVIKWRRNQMNIEQLAHARRTNHRISQIYLIYSMARTRLNHPYQSNQTAAVIRPVLRPCIEDAFAWCRHVDRSRPASSAGPPLPSAKGFRLVVSACLRIKTWMNIPTFFFYAYSLR